MTAFFKPNLGRPAIQLTRCAAIMLPARSVVTNCSGYGHSALNGSGWDDQ